MTKILVYRLVDGFVHHWLWLDGIPLTAPPPKTPYENAPASDEKRWVYCRATPDHWTFGVGTAYTQLDFQEPTILHLVGEGIRQVWVAGVAVSEHELQLDPGEHSLMISMAGAMQVTVSSNAQVHIHTAAQDLDRRKKIERVLDLASLDRDVYAGTQRIVVTWSELQERSNVWAQVQHLSGRTYNSDV
jgi:hypothetical protein